MAKKDKIEFVEPGVDEQTIIASASEWGQPDWKRGKVILHAKNGTTRLVRFANLPPEALIVIPMED